MSNLPPIFIVVIMFGLLFVTLNSFVLVLIPSLRYLFGGVKRRTPTDRPANGATPARITTAAFVASLEPVGAASTLSAERAKTSLPQGPLSKPAGPMLAFLLAIGVAVGVIAVSDGLQQPGRAR